MRLPTHRALTGASLPLTLAALFWAGNALLGRALRDDIPPVSLAFWRWAVAAMVLLPFAWRHVVRDAGIIRRSWPILFLLSVLGVSSFNAMLYHAAHTTTATNISLILTAMPAAIVVMNLVFFGERASRWKVAGAGLAMAGAAVVVLRGDVTALSELDVVDGDLWMSVAVVAYALYSVLLRRGPSVHPMTFVAVTFTMGALVLLPGAVWEARTVGGADWSAAVVAGVLYAAIFPSILAYLFWNRGVALAGAAYAGLFICLGPIFTALLAAPLLGESLRGFHLAGFVLIVGGLLLFQRGPSSPSAAAQGADGSPGTTA